LLDRRSRLLENIDFIKRAYVNLLTLKQLESEACENGSYEVLHELSENERRIIQDINGTLKIIVPDIMYLRGDEIISKGIREIEDLQTSLIQKSMNLRENIEQKMFSTKKELDRLSDVPRLSTPPTPAILNVRA
jgi:hypothetical protein